jgi:hypothetical protein
LYREISQFSEIQCCSFRLSLGGKEQKGVNCERENVRMGIIGVNWSKNGDQTTKIPQTTYKNQDMHRAPIHKFTNNCCLVKIQGLRQEIRHYYSQSYSSIAHATVGPKAGRRSRRACIPDRRDHHFPLTFFPTLRLQQPFLSSNHHIQFKMASAVRFGSSAFRSSLAAPAFNARIAAFNGARCYSAKTQVNQFPNNTMKNSR